MADEEHIKIPLKTIPEPKPSTRTVYVAKTIPIFKGIGNIDKVCGNCNQTLVKGSGSNFTINNIVIKCICGSFNEIP